MLSTKLKEAAGNSADATLYVDDVFSTYLYTGNGSTQTITNGIDLAGKGGLVWIKCRSNATTNHRIFDTQRGVQNSISSNLTTAQDFATSSLDGFLSSGFSLQGFDGEINDSPRTYASWTFRKAAKFFDVQTITHTSGTANNIDFSTLGYGLSMVIAKITTSAGDWKVWHGSLQVNSNLILNLPDAQSTSNAWISASSSNTTVTLSASAPTGTYVIYAFALDENPDGIINSGGFTTNSSGVADYPYLGWEPQWLLIKSAYTSEDWYIVDSMRGFTASSSDQILKPNSSIGEANYNYIQPTALGFKATGLAANSGYVCLAIRRPNKPPTSGTQVYNAQRTASTTNPQTVTTGFVTDLALRQDPSSGAPTWFNRLTGPALFIQSSNTNAETNPGVNGFNCDKMNGWSDASSGVGVQRQYWGFKRAPGFMDVVCYTGTGVAEQAYNHNLTAVPDFVIIKKRSSSTQSDWTVKVRGIPNGLYLNDSSGNVWSESVTSLSSTTFTVSGDNRDNASASTYVAYLFATLAGIQYINSYVGDGTTGRVINCGFSAGARFICIKATSTTGSWWVWDSARGITSTNDPVLQLNSTAAEITSADAIDPSSSGFIVNQEATCSINASGVSYLVWAIA